MNCGSRSMRGSRGEIEGRPQSGGRSRCVPDRDPNEGGYAFRLRERSVERRCPVGCALVSEHVERRTSRCRECRRPGAETPWPEGRNLIGTAVPVPVPVSDRPRGHVERDGPSRGTAPVFPRIPVLRPELFGRRTQERSLRAGGRHSGTLGGRCRNRPRSRSPAFGRIAPCPMMSCHDSLSPVGEGARTS